MRSSQFGCQTIFCRIAHFLCCQELPHWSSCLPLQAGLALPRSLAGSTFPAASACPPESCFVGDKGNLEHGTILCHGTVGPVLLSMATCAGRQARALGTWTWCWAGWRWPWHIRKKTGGSERSTYDVLCNEQLTVNIAYGNRGP